MARFITSPDGLNIAFNAVDGSSPAVMFMPGFFSNMEGTKATFLEERCRERGQAYVRFDYRGHGQSDGRFEDGTFSDWLADTLLVLDHAATGPVVAVGSSMGGFIALHCALKRPGRVAGLVGIATSPDFTESIYRERMTPEQRLSMQKQGYIETPSEYREEPVRITQKLIDDGKNHLLMIRDRIELDIPVCLIHGKKDADVPWRKSAGLQEKIGREQCELILVPDGEHRLSRQKDLRLIHNKVREICSKVSHKK
jgi:pimeloyl-ACP methyl ester carboxylesterase